MNLSRSVPFLFGFWIALLAALAVRFHDSVLPPAAGDSIRVALLVCVSILFLAKALSSFGFKNSKVPVAAAVIFASGAYFGVSALEDHLSENRLDRADSISSFRGLTDHCGLHAGRAVIRLFDSLFMSETYASLREYRIDTECRLRHFIRLEKANRLGCTDEEGAIRCRIRWMGAFSEKGFWNYDARNYFFEDVMRLWRADHQDEALVAFVLEDQRLQMSLMGEFQQAGIAPSVPGVVRDSKITRLRHHELSRKIFDTVAEAIHDGAANSSAEPFRFKFHDAYVEFLAKGRGQL
ncbi:MAG: hypothetical protein EBX52_00025 [Proteobacteria bacterium]|nr:hypothetical protein [Pseudomonadota bacterium]